MAGKQHKSGARKSVPTPDQRRARAEMATLSAAWNALAEEQREAWEVEAHTSRRGGRTARSRRRSGRRLFFKVNFRRLALGQELFKDPSGTGSWAATPLVRLVITNHAGRIVLKLRVARGEAAGLMVSSWHPLNAGVMKWKKFVRLGLLPAPVRGMSDITRLYVAKFGAPPVGKKVFIRIQQMNDYSGGVSFITSAVVPEEEGWQGA